MSNLLNEHEAKTEPVKMESNILATLTLDCNRGQYFQVYSEAKVAPLYLAVSHDDTSFLGVQIFWSRKSKYPFIDDCEGYFNATGSKTICF